MLTAKEVAELLRVSRMSVNRLVATGALTAVRVGHQYRFEQVEIDRYLGDNRTTRRAS